MKDNKKHINDKEIIEQRILSQSSSYTVPTGKTKETVWNELLHDINVEQSTKKRIVFKPLYKIVAAVIVVVVSSIAFLYSDTKITTNFAENSEIYLPDSSYVFLQSGSSISFNKRTWNVNRELTLNGEAYFSVKKGSNFTVKTENGTVEVLGTKFNVVSRMQNFNVSCVTGKVRVSLAKSRSKVILTKGLYTVKLENGKLATPSEKDIEVVIKRNKGEFYFEKTDLKLVFEELERQFDVEIEYQDIKNRQFTGYFLNKDLETALKMVCKPMELEYTVNNRLIIIKDLAKLNKTE